MTMLIRATLNWVRFQSLMTLKNRIFHYNLVIFHENAQWNFLPVVQILLFIRDIKGVRASETMANTDLSAMNRYKWQIRSVARRKGVDPAVIAGQ